MLGVFIVESREWYSGLCFTAAMLLLEWVLSKTCTASEYYGWYRLGVAVLTILVEMGGSKGG
jgi:hypothetical protein